MVYELKGKVALVTGAANGVGAGVVRMLLAEGAKHVAILDIDEPLGVAFQKELNTKFGANKSKFYQCDVTNDDQLFGAFQSVVKGQGGIDLVVNNAAIMNDAPHVYKKEIAVNVTALVTSTLKALELMRTDEGGKGGTVINVASIAALSQATHLPIYFATKSAVLQFSNCIGQKDYYDKTGVRVLTICFGATDTSLLSERKMGSLDNNLEEYFDVMKNIYIQRMESAAQGVIDAYKKGASGSTWVASRDLPAVDITDNVNRAYEILGEHNHVAILDIDEPLGVAFQKELNTKFGANKSKFYQCDVTNDDQLFGAFQSVVKGQGGIDLVVNNAAIMNDAPHVYKKEIAVNVTALVTSTLKALELMRTDEGGKGGTVINVASIAALSQATHLPIYFATKSAVLQFSNCIGQKDYYDKTGVRVLTICFGATDTSLLSERKMGSLDNNLEEYFDVMKNIYIQRMESAAQGVIDAYKKGASGSTWVASRDLPAVDITDNVNRAYEILGEHN